MKGVVVWLTGLPSSGKSTLAAAVRSVLRANGVASCVLDSDAVRDAISPKVGYSEPERDFFYATLARLATLLTKQGFAVLVPATAHRREYRDRARLWAPHFIEVYVRTPTDECERRDTKGLYKRARSGELVDFPGVNAPFEEPAEADVIADNGATRKAVETVVAAIEKALMQNRRALALTPGESRLLSPIRKRVIPPSNLGSQVLNQRTDVDQTLAEHQGCLQVLVEVEDCLARPQGDGGWSAAILDRLRGLDVTLRRHFAGEEKGLFGRLPIDHPELAPQVKKLKEEHAAILVLLLALTEKAAGPGSNKANHLSHELAAQVERLVAKVRRHEAEENELIMAAHWNTFGTSG